MREIMEPCQAKPSEPSYIIYVCACVRTGFTTRDMKKNEKQLHNGWVVFNDCEVYPEFVLQYESPGRCLLRELLAPLINRVVDNDAEEEED